MPTITLSTASPSGMSRSSTPGTRMMTKSPGKAVSLSRLDNLQSKQPRNFAKKLHAHTTAGAGAAPKRQVQPPKSPPKKKMSQSLSHLAMTPKKLTVPQDKPKGEF